MPKKKVAETKKKTPDLTAILGEAEKDQKGSALVELDTESLTKSIPHISTGSLAIDYLIGGKENTKGVRPCPGIPRGKITNIYGLAGSGKTTIALQTAATACEEGTCVYIDFENEVEPRYAQALGVPVTDKSRFMLLQPETLEQGMKLMVKFASAGVDLIVVDSVGAGVPLKFFADPGGQQQVGLLAQKWSQFLPIFKQKISDSKTAVIGISQLREKMGGMGGFGSGPTRDAQGGNAWKYYSCLRMMLRVIGKDKGKDWDGMQQKVVETVKGNIARASLDKCKVSDSVHHQQDYYLTSGVGVDNERTILELAMKASVVKKAGAWYSWSDPSNAQEYKGQGLEGFRNLLPEGWLATMFNQVKPYLSDKRDGGSGGLAEVESDAGDLDDFGGILGDS
jgi:recombination protein RecA